MQIPLSGSFDAFAMIVDINGFTPFVGESDASMIAQVTRDILIGSISAIEEEGGSVMGIMGDAIFGVLPDAHSSFMASSMIAKDLDNLCSYLYDKHDPIKWRPSLKIGIEFGLQNISSISTKALGNQVFLIGGATNYASRILSAGKGNRCHVGPKAARAGLNDYSLGSEKTVRGKKRESSYTYQQLDLSDIWVEGSPRFGHHFW